MIELESNGKISARKLHKWLESKRRFNSWWNFKKEQAELIENKHYLVGYKFVTSFNREYEDYRLTENAALDLSLMEGTKRGKEVRDLLKEIFNQRNSGELYSANEVLGLIKLIKVSFYKEFRDKARYSHLDKYLPKNREAKGYDYAKANIERNKVCGIDKNKIQEKLLEFNYKFNGIEKGLIKVDKHEIIRICVIDVLISLGKSVKQAVNAGNLAKELSLQDDYGTFTRKNDMFTLPKQLEETYKLLN